jgi:hypothetical protein
VQPLESSECIHGQWQRRPEARRPVELPVSEDRPEASGASPVNGAATGVTAIGPASEIEAEIGITLVRLAGLMFLEAERRIGGESTWGGAQRWAS